MHGVDGPFDRGRPRKLVYPSPSNRKTNAAGALVVEALPGEGSAELRLDRGALCVEEVEKGFVVRRDRIVDVQLRASFILEHSVVPPLAVSFRPQPAVPVGGDSGVEVRLLIGVREQGRPERLPRLVSVRAVDDLVGFVVRVCDRIGDGRFLSVEV